VSITRGLLYGVLLAIGTALVYAAFAEILGFTLGLLVVGFCGGWLIGNGIAYGTWTAREHTTIKALQWTALALAVLTWIGALLLAFVISQALLPQATTPLGDRLTLGGFVDYFMGLDIERFIHVISLALMALMAWRGAR